MENGKNRSSYRDDVALAPGDLVATSEEIANRLEEFPNVRLHFRFSLSCVLGLLSTGGGSIKPFLFFLVYLLRAESSFGPKTKLNQKDMFLFFFFFFGYRKGTQAPKKKQQKENTKKQLNSQLNSQLF